MPCCPQTALGVVLEGMRHTAGSGLPCEGAASAGAELDASTAGRESAGSLARPGRPSTGDTSGAALPIMREAVVQRLHTLERRVRLLEQSLGAAHRQAQPLAVHSHELDSIWS